MIFHYLILAGGKLPPKNYLKKLIRYSKAVVTVDRGAYGALALGIKPLLHVGDGDSFPSRLLKKLRPSSTVMLEKRKSVSDLEKTLEIINHKAMSCIVGAHSDDEGRIDHGFFNILLLEKFNFYLVDEKNWITRIPPRNFIFTTPRKSFFSLFPASSSMLSAHSSRSRVVSRNVVSISGAEYNKKNTQLRYYTEGLSNVAFAGKKVKISTQKGSLLFVGSDLTQTKIDDPRFAG